MKNNKAIYIILFVVICWMTYLTTSMLSSKQEDKQKEITNIYNVSGFSTDMTKVVSQCESGIVTIRSAGNIMSGFVYAQNGDKVYIVTAFHGIGEGNIDVFFKSSYSLTAKLIGQDIYCDLAVLEVSTPYEIAPLKMGDSSLLKEGEFIISIGTPKSLEYAGSAELGMVAYPERTVSNSIIFEGNSYSYFLDAIQLSANLKPGYSGSPLINMNGELVGMTTMSIDSDIIFAVRGNELKIIADGIINQTNVHKVQLGLKGSYVKNMHNYEKANLNLPIEVLGGMYVERTRENSLSNLAGIRSGDIITAINGIELNSSDDYLKAAYTDTKSFEFTVIRGSETLKLTGNIND